MLHALGDATVKQHALQSQLTMLQERLKAQETQHKQDMARANVLAEVRDYVYWNERRAFRTVHFF